MRLTVNKRDFQEALKKVISEKKSNLPILTNFLLKAEEDNLYIYGTDLEVYSTYKLPAVIEEEGEICVNAKKLMDISKVLPTSDVLLDTSDSSLKVISGKTKYSLPTANPDDFPVFEKFPDNLSITVPSNALLRGIDKTIYAASKDESRYTLNGVCFSFISNKLDLVATDGHRLALYQIDYGGKIENNRFIVPLKALNELKKLLPDAIDVDIAVYGSNMFFRSRDWVLQTRLLEGVFPDYTVVIPREFTIEVNVPKGEFIESLKRVIVAIEDSTKPIRLTLLPNEIKISSASDGINAEDEVDVEYSGEEFEIGFNGAYLLDAIEEIEGDTALIKFTGKDSQTVVESADKNDPYLAIVMPMNI
ncbi:MAG: DNA polymerase III subunit beta [Hydrogenothermaceae bacterium]